MRLKPLIDITAICGLAAVASMTLAAEISDITFLIDPFGEGFGSKFAFWDAHNAEDQLPIVQPQTTN